MCRLLANIHSTRTAKHATSVPSYHRHSPEQRLLAPASAPPLGARCKRRCETRAPKTTARTHPPSPRRPSCGSSCARLLRAAPRMRCGARPVPRTPSRQSPLLQQRNVKPGSKAPVGFNTSRPPHQLAAPHAQRRRSHASRHRSQARLPRRAWDAVARGPAAPRRAPSGLKLQTFDRDGRACTRLSARAAAARAGARAGVGGRRGRGGAARGCVARMALRRARRAARGGAPRARHRRVPCHLSPLAHPRQRDLQRVGGGRFGHFC